MVRDLLAAQSLCTLGVIAVMREDMLVAKALLRQSLAVRMAATPPARRADVAESQLNLARLLFATGRAAEAVVRQIDADERRCIA